MTFTQDPKSNVPAAPPFAPSSFDANLRSQCYDRIRRSNTCIKLSLAKRDLDMLSKCIDQILKPVGYVCDHQVAAELQQLRSQLQESSSDWTGLCQRLVQLMTRIAA